MSKIFAHEYQQLSKQIRGQHLDGLLYERAKDKKYRTELSKIINKIMYFDFLPNKKKRIKNDGNPYIVSPYSLAWNGDYSDMNAYIQTSPDEIEVEVEGVSLKLGMSYDEVLETGLSLVTSEYADKLTNGMIVVCQFGNTSGKVAGLGFDADENKTLKEGVLRLVGCGGPDSQRNANITVNHIGMDSSIEDIISVFGDSISTLSVIYGKYLSIGYYSEVRDLRVEFVINPETESIYEIKVTDNR